MKRNEHSTNPSGNPYPGDGFPDWLLELYLTGTWELDGIESFDPHRYQWISADEFATEDCFWEFNPHPQKSTAGAEFLPGRYRQYVSPGYNDTYTAVWFITDGALILEREEPKDGILIPESWTEPYRIEPLSPERCLLYSLDNGRREPEDFTFRNHLKRSV